MEIVSWNFLLFSLLSIAVYYCLNRRAQNIWLLVVSYFFYATWSWYFPVVLLLTTLMDFAIAKKISAAGENKRKTWFWLGLGVNIGALFLYRALDNPALLLSVLPLFSLKADLFKDVILPIGFSFYCLQGISYIIDVYKSRIEPEHDMVDFALYMSFFPKIIAGPIERAAIFLPQLKNPRLVDNEKLESGFAQIIIGLFRKIVIAGLILYYLPEGFLTAPVVNSHPSLGWLSFPFFNFTQPASYYVRLSGIFGYVIYLYNDFAGYSSIARGISILLGLKITENFKQPFLAHSLMDFWNRWHISLSSWLRDYIYFPLTRAILRKNKNKALIVNVGFPLITTLLASGIWHGLFPGMILWGFLQGMVLIIEHILFRKFPFLNPIKQPKIRLIFHTIIVFCTTTILFVPFASKSLPEALAFWKVLIKGTSQPLKGELSIFIVILLMISFALDNLQHQSKDELFYISWPATARGGVLVVALMTIAIAAVWTMSSITPQFVYQGF